MEDHPEQGSDEQTEPETCGYREDCQRAYESFKSNMIMEIWKATIKEKGNELLLTPEYHLSNQYYHISDANLRECEIRKFLRKFWGLDNADVEWYKLERIYG